MPLRALFRTVDFLQAARRIKDAFEQKQAAALIDDAERLVQRLKSYKLALVRIQGGTPEQAVEIFSRLSAVGRPMAAEQMLSALTLREGLGGSAARDAA